MALQPLFLFAFQPYIFQPLDALAVLGYQLAAVAAVVLTAI
jgi:hypothetical protein